MTAVVLQGARTEEYWVTKFRLEYSSDLSGNTWAAVTDGYDSVVWSVVKVFTLRKVAIVDNQLDCWVHQSGYTLYSQLGGLVTTVK